MLARNIQLKFDGHTYAERNENKNSDKNDKEVIYLQICQIMQPQR